jgi:alpha/beta superfamily hydrolase
VRPVSERRSLDGPAGHIECVIERPVGAVRGFAFIGHPHPLYGGSLDNKVAVTLARAFLALGWVAVRPNFRGVGDSEGTHDDGRGETQDFLFLVDQVPRLPPWKTLAPPPVPIALAGFSFGSFVAARAAQDLAQRSRPVRSLVLVGTAAGKWPVPKVDPATLVIHGEVDATIALGDVFAWARESEVPVVVIPGADHFFHRRLTTLKRLVVQNLAGAAQLAAAAGEGPVSSDADPGGGDA